jgi:hypothetical protein
MPVAQQVICVGANSPAVSESWQAVFLRAADRFLPIFRMRGDITFHA